MWLTVTSIALPRTPLNVPRTPLMPPERVLPLPSLPPMMISLSLKAPTPMTSSKSSVSAPLKSPRSSSANRNSIRLVPSMPPLAPKMATPMAATPPLPTVAKAGVLMSLLVMERVLMLGPRTPTPYSESLMVTPSMLMLSSVVPKQAANRPAKKSPPQTKTPAVMGNPPLKPSMVKLLPSPMRLKFRPGVL